MSEFQLNLLRQRSLEAIRQTAQRGELRFCLPVGFCCGANKTIELDPDLRVQNAIHLVFRWFQELGSARQLLLWCGSIRMPGYSEDEALSTLSTTSEKHDPPARTFRIPATRSSVGWDLQT